MDVSPLAVRALPQDFWKGSFQVSPCCFKEIRTAFLLLGDFFLLLLFFLVKTWKIAFDQFHNLRCRSGGLIFQARSSVHLSVLSEIFVAPEHDGAGRMGLGDG